MNFGDRLVEQFGNPAGALGNVAGFIMAHRSSNIERVNWAVSLLDARPHDRILEIGFGPGLAIQRMSELVTQGTIYGIDHSELMLKQASARNQKAIAAGRVRLFRTPASELPVFGEPVDKILDINTFQFWNDQIETLKNVKKLLRPGGIMAIVHEPRNAGAGEADVIEAGKRFSECMKRAGFKNISVEKKIMKPLSTICLLGENP